MRKSTVNPMQKTFLFTKDEELLTSVPCGGIYLHVCYLLIRNGQ
jgi:hypothetical protein